MANELHTFTGNEVIATELPELLNQNFNYIQDNSLTTVNGVEKDENNNVDVTFLTSQVISTNSDLNNFRESGEYTRELDTIVVANSPTEKPFFLTVLASENLVKQVVTEIDRKDPMTFTRTLSGANWSPWVEGGVDIGIWKSEETVKVGDVRFLKGRENAGYILECVTAGTTGENQPVISEEDVENAEGIDINDLNGVVPIEKGGTGATTASEACANIGALPLSGGEMVGIIKKSGIVIQAHDTSNSLELLASDGYVSGGVLALYGGTNTFNNGGFLLRASKDSSAMYDLAGNTDGSLTWGGKNLLLEGQGGYHTGNATSIGGASATKPAVVVTTYVSNTSGYRVWSDGYKEQWGRIETTTGGYGTTVTFPKAFTNTNYSVTVSDYNYNDTWNSGCKTLTTTSMYVYLANNKGAMWRACGY